MTAAKFLGKYRKSLFIVNYEERVSDQTPNQIAFGILCQIKVSNGRLRGLKQ